MKRGEGGLTNHHCVSIGGFVGCGDSLSPFFSPVFEWIEEGD